MGDPLVELAIDLRGKLTPAEQLAVLDAALQRAFGFKVFSINRYDAATDETSRIYSTAPLVWPIAGRKKRKPNFWSAQVIDRGEIHIGSTADDIRAVFDDHAQIAAQGCAAILNIPVRWNGKTLGALNLLHEAHHYDGCDRGRALAFAALAVPILAEVD